MKKKISKKKEIVEAYKKVRRAWTRNPRTKIKISAKLYKRKGRRKETADG